MKIYRLALCPSTPYGPYGPMAPAFLADDASPRTLPMVLDTISWSYARRTLMAPIPMATGPMAV